MMTPTASCSCGNIPIGARGVCATCEDDLRDLLLPASRNGALRQIAAIAESEATADSLPNIARIARHGLSLKD